MSLSGTAWVRLNCLTPVPVVSTPTCTDGVWPPLHPVSVAQKNKPLTMLSSNVQSIDLLMDCSAWLFWKMRQSNGCSTPAPRSGVAKQFTAMTRSKEKSIFYKCAVFQCFLVHAAGLWGFTATVLANRFARFKTLILYRRKFRLYDGAGDHLCWNRLSYFF